MRPYSTESDRRIEEHQRNQRRLAAWRARMRRHNTLRADGSFDLPGAANLPELLRRQAI